MAPNTTTAEFNIQTQKIKFATHDDHEMLEIMKQEGKNIPFTGHMIRGLKTGFTPTSVFTSKHPNFNYGGSKFIPSSQYNQPK